MDDDDWIPSSGDGSSGSAYAAEEDDWSLDGGGAAYDHLDGWIPDGGDRAHDHEDDGINSLGSPGLREQRPNKWLGPPGTWRTANDEERRLTRAIDASRDRDLAVHLFSAFGMKRNAGLTVAHRKRYPRFPPASLGPLPAKSWTAWPLEPDQVPDIDFVTGKERAMALPSLDLVAAPWRQHGSGWQPPSRAVEEELVAAMMRVARERFWARVERWKREPAPAVTVEGGEGAKGSRRKKEAKTYMPTVSADDDASYALLRPQARKIISATDRVLMILHYMRLATVKFQRAHNLPGSGGGASERGDRATAASRVSGRSIASTPTAAAPEKRKTKKKTAGRGKGRPRIEELLGPDVTPEVNLDRIMEQKREDPRRKTRPALPGETERAYLIRIARESKRKIPKFDSEPEERQEPEPVGASAGAEGQEKDGIRGGQEAGPGSSNKKPKPARTPEEAAARLQRSRTDHLARIGLRDWSDVVGAAATAGFSRSVIERTAQRCANLFGQGMDLLATGSDGSVTRKTVAPEPAIDAGEKHAADEDGENEAEQQARLWQDFIAKRQQTLASIHTEEEEDKEAGRKGRGRRRNVAFSQSNACPVRTCPRSLELFSRRANLARHLGATHGYSAEEARTAVWGSGASRSASTSRSGVRSRSRSRLPRDANLEDMLDGIHRDGFLRQIAVRPGWRGPDVQKRRSRARPRDPSEPATLSKSSKPTRSRKPAKATMKLVKPTKPAKQAKPTKLTRSVKPTKPAKPAKPAKPIEPAEPKGSRSRDEGGQGGEKRMRGKKRKIWGVGIGDEDGEEDEDEEAGWDERGDDLRGLDSDEVPRWRRMQKRKRMKVWR